MCHVSPPNGDWSCISSRQRTACSISSNSTKPTVFWLRSFRVREVM